MLFFVLHKNAESRAAHNDNNPWFEPRGDDSEAPGAGIPQREGDEIVGGWRPRLLCDVAQRISYVNCCSFLNCWLVITMRPGRVAGVLAVVLHLMACLPPVARSQCTCSSDPAYNFCWTGAALDFQWITAGNWDTSVGCTYPGTVMVLQISIFSPQIKGQAGITAKYFAYLLLNY